MAITALHVLHSSLPNLSGYSVRAAEIMRYLRRHGIEPAAVTSAQQEPAPAELVETVDGVETWRTPPPMLAGITGHLPGARELTLMRALQRRIGQAAAALAPGLIHAHSPVLCGLPAKAVAESRRVPLIYEVRDFWENASVDVGKFAYGSARYRVARALECSMLRAADAVVVLSAGQRAEVMRRGVPLERTWLAPNGVDPAAISRGDPARLVGQWGLAGRKVILYLGAFLAYEGLEVLLAAMPQITTAEGRATLVLVGDGPMRPLLEKQAAELGLGQAVRFIGRVPREAVGSYYALARLAVYPRLRTLTTELTTPLKPLEAMALQVPVVASDLPAMRELVEDGKTGLLAQPGDVADLAARCIQMLRQTQKAAEMAAEAHHFALVERAWDVTLAPYLELYQSLLPEG